VRVEDISDLALGVTTKKFVGHEQPSRGCDLIIEFVWGARDTTIMRN
jgi:hypothetical protein